MLDDQRKHRIKDLQQQLSKVQKSHDRLMAGVKKYKGQLHELPQEPQPPASPNRQQKAQAKPEPPIINEKYTKIKDEHFKNIAEIYSELLKFDQEANKKLEDIIKLSQQIEQIEKINDDYNSQISQMRHQLEEKLRDLQEGPESQ